MQSGSFHTSALTADVDLLEAARAFFPDLTATDGIPNHPNLLKVHTPGGLRRVHRWPEAAPQGDIAFSQDVMAMAREAGVTSIAARFALPANPEAPALRLGRHWYDAQAWLPGAPPARAEVAWPGFKDQIDIPLVLPSAVFSEVVAATARLHEATTALAARRDVPAVPLAMLPGTVRQAQGRHLGAFRAQARREPAIQRWLATGERLLANAEPIILAATEAQELPSSVLHLGLWPAHVLMSDGTLTGLIGWERVAAGSPLLDIAQAIIRLQGWSDDAAEAALATYGVVRPLSPEERRLLSAVAALDAVATTGRLLEQTFAVAETARPPTALRAAIDMMLGSMSALDRNLLTLANVGKSKRTLWRRGPRTTAHRAGGKPRAQRH